MKFELNGISSPYLGISWNKTTTSKEKFASLLFYLESKRILVNPIEMEKKEWCLESVLEIKQQLVTMAKDSAFKEKELAIIRSMIDACNKYLDSVSPMDLPTIIYKNGNHWEDLQFDSAMKAFRHSFREDIHKIESKFKLKFQKDIPEQY